MSDSEGWLSDNSNGKLELIQNMALRIILKIFQGTSKEAVKVMSGISPLSIWTKQLILNFWLKVT